VAGKELQAVVAGRMNARTTILKLRCMVVLLQVWKVTAVVVDAAIAAVA
jgi:hypothetical protein